MVDVYGIISGELNDMSLVAVAAGAGAGRPGDIMVSPVELECENAGEGRPTDCFRDSRAITAPEKASDQVVDGLA